MGGRKLSAILIHFQHICLLSLNRSIRLTELENVKGWNGPNDHLVPTSHAMGHLPLYQVAQGLIQPAFEHCQGWGPPERP